MTFLSRSSSRRFVFLDLGDDLLGLLLGVFDAVLDLLVRIGHAQHPHAAHPLRNGVELGLRFQQPGIVRHDRLALRGVARVAEVAEVPVGRLLAALAGQVRADPPRTPLERMVVHRFARLAVFAVALRLGQDRADHLRMAVVAAVFDVDVAAQQLQRRIGLHRGNRGDVRLDEEQGDDLEQRGRDHGARSPRSVNRSGCRSPRRCHQPCSQTSSRGQTRSPAAPFSRDSGSGGSAYLRRQGRRLVDRLLVLGRPGGPGLQQVDAAEQRRRPGRACRRPRESSTSASAPPPFPGSCCSAGRPWRSRARHIRPCVRPAT